MSRRLYRLIVVPLTLVVLAAIGLGGASGTALAASLPVLTQVAPAAGPLAPSTVVLTGRNLSGANAVSFGSQRGTIVQKISATSVSVRTPAHARLGAFPVRIHTAAGWSAVTTAARYTFAAAPKLTAVTPNSGPYTGGQSVSLTGTALGMTTKVSFGTEAATITSKSPTKVVVLSPVGVLGATTVTVTTPGGTSGGVPFTYVEPAQQNTQTVTPTDGTYQVGSVNWVTGGYDPDTGQTAPWVLNLPQDAPLPTVGKPLLLKPGSSAAFPSGLTGTVDDVAVQVDQSIRVTVTPSDLTDSFDELSVDYSGPAAAANSGASVASETAVDFPIDGSALFCHDQQGRSVSFGADLSMHVSDVDVSQHLHLGGLVSRPTYDATLTAEVTTTGKFHASAASTCEIAAAWANAHRRVIPLGTSGATVSFGPAFEFSVSAAGTLSILDRTRTTFAINSEFGKTPQLSRTSRTVESSYGGALSFDATLSAGVEIQFGLLDRAGVVGKAMIGVDLGLEASGSNVCATGKIIFSLSIGLFLDAWVARWESPTLTATFDLYTFASRCVASDPSSPPTDEPQIVSARMPDAQIGTDYSARLETADNRAGSWSIVRYSLPAGLTLDPGSGEISGTPTGPVGDNAVIIDFTDGSGQAATTTIRIRVQPGAGIGGGDVQVTLRWTGPADLDLHVLDPSGEEIYYANTMSGSGGSLDHDANAACNGPADDDNAVENVFWPPHSAPAGSYTAFVNVYDECGGPLDWHLTIRRNGVVVVDQSGNGNSDGYTFTVGASATGAAHRPLPSRTYPAK